MRKLGKNKRGEKPEEADVEELKWNSDVAELRWRTQMKRRRRLTKLRRRSMAEKEVEICGVATVRVRSGNNGDEEEGLKSF
ncbi:unnamed protein product [Ilex paraguariensis]|uniref:Uncharacterized protein n=1 Tax=Ilex paraguariensis TaxID=185542 RepID=A0ABC8R835_9AQUA